MNNPIRPGATIQGRLRHVASTALLACGLFVPAMRPLAAQGAPADLLIRNGRVIDGTGAPARSADIAVTGDRITFVGDAARANVQAKRTIDARGLIVAPGFIDPHTHTLEDLSSDDPKRRANTDYLMQGVTTVITGNDGGGPYDVARTLAKWKANGIGSNGALLVGYGTVRQAVMGMSDARAHGAQLDSMRALVAKGMREGALGMSTGLYYAPQSYATTDEVIAMANVAAKYGGIYDTHLRDESSYTVGLLAAIREAIRIGHEAGMPSHISHIKALGTDVWGRSDSAIAIIDAARKAGDKVTANQYPYTASGSSVGASLLPRWAEVGGRDSLRARVVDPATKARLVTDMTENLRRRGGAKSLLITSTRDTSILGRTLEDVAKARDVSPVEAAIQIVVAGDASVASFNMDEEDIVAFMRQPWVMTGSDGSAGHPRKYGTFPKKWAEYVRAKQVLTPEQFVRRSSALTAETFSIKDRGVLAKGKYADVVVFDDATFKDHSTYQKPTELATGMKYVIVNGKLAVDGGTYTGVMAGVGITR
ncbi:MAG TPA: amidohydrolase family protein [Gemmatimonadaceae bacterium]|jgi:N-acyl-D-aspartate/D-glutamate deacylase|nr:amidohydrolase family protein [Gemmatimonadaceae bacterium]